MLKRIILIGFFICCLSPLCVKAEENVAEVSYLKIPEEVITAIIVQNKVEDVGYKILNANKIDYRIIFTYQTKNSKLDIEPELKKRQIMVVDKTIQFISNEDELASYLAMKIAKTRASYKGVVKGFITSAQVKCAPKKFELYFDKKAIDYMVTAGYNPLGFITFIHKCNPQKRFDIISTHNLTSKRLAYAYEYIYTKYPYFIKNNEYLENDTYQNFLLSSIENRKKLYEKITTKSNKVVSYE